MIVLQVVSASRVEHVTLAAVTITRVLYSMVNVHAQMEVVLQMFIHQFVPHLHLPLQRQHQPLQTPRQPQRHPRLRRLAQIIAVYLDLICGEAMPHPLFLAGPWSLRIWIIQMEDYGRRINVKICAALILNVILGCGVVLHLHVIYQLIRN